MSLHSSTFLTRALVVLACFTGVVACSTSNDDESSEEDDETDGEDSYEGTSDALQSAGPCAGKPIDIAVQCAVRKGASVLSYYRSPGDQQRVRRENHCRNVCTGMSGCVRPTANCTTSPHTRCLSVDLIADGAPVTKAALRECGLAKTTAPHRNHYDLVNN